MNKNKKVNIGIIGATLWGNRGAESMLVTTIAQLRIRYPNAEFKVFSYYPVKDKSLCLDTKVEILNFTPYYLALVLVPLSFFKLKILKELKALSKCLKVYDLSGISFSDGRKIFLLYNIAILLPALFFNVPVVKLAQAVGPFNEFINRFFAKKFLSKCEHVYARGLKTFKHLENLQIPLEKFSLSSDIAFLYNSNYSLTIENEAIVANYLEFLTNSKKKIVTIIPSSLLARKNPYYIKKIIILSEYLVNKGYHISFVPNATRASSSKSRNNDLIVIEEIKKLLSLHYVSFIDFDLNTLGIRKLLSCSDFVITSRFHGMVASLSLEKPTYVIGWSHKYEEVLEFFECEKYSVNSEIKENELIERIAKFIKNRFEIEDKIKKNMQKVRDLTFKQFV